MIKRIVRMKLLPGQENLFLNTFDLVKKHIRAQEGCVGLELLNHEENGHVSIWTISLWEKESDLDRYRSSDLFKTTWSAVKPLFAEKAQAWTLTTIDLLP